MHEIMQALWLCPCIQLNAESINPDRRLINTQQPDIKLGKKMEASREINRRADVGNCTSMKEDLQSSHPSLASTQSNKWIPNKRLYQYNSSTFTIKFSKAAEDKQARPEASVMETEAAPRTRHFELKRNQVQHPQQLYQLLQS